MTKWFDTNYHYLVPELERGQRFSLRAEHWTGPLREAAALGIATRPVVLGPLSLPPAVEGRRAAAGRARRADPRLRAAAATSCARRARPRSRSTSRASRWTARPRELDAFTDAWTELNRHELDLCLATYFAPVDRAC